MSNLDNLGDWISENITRLAFVIAAPITAVLGIQILARIQMGDLVHEHWITACVLISFFCLALWTAFKSRMLVKWGVLILSLDAVSLICAVLMITGQ